MNSEENVHQGESDPVRDSRRAIWIVGGLAVAALVVLACGVLVIATFFIGRQVGGRTRLEPGPISGEPPGQLAMVNDVRIENRRGQFVALVQGELPNVCTQIGQVTQEIKGEVIEVTVRLTPPQEGVVCIQVVAPYTKEIPLDTNGLRAGEYAVAVNGFVVPLTLP